MSVYNPASKEFERKPKLRKKNWKRRKLAICSIALTLSFASCQTSDNSISLPRTQRPPWPTPPAERPVVFSNAPDGLLLELDEYRKLEENFIELRRYIAELEAQLHFYRTEIGEAEK